MKKIGLLFPFLLAPLLFNCNGKDPEPTPTDTYNVITTFTHCSSTDVPTEIKKNESLTFHVKADEDYALPESIDVTGCKCDYKKEAQSITISNPTSDVSITVNAPQVIFTYTITSTFNNCSSADVPEQIKTGQSITFTVTPDKNYVLDPSSINIEGCEYDFDQDNNKITLRDPTKDVTITITAKFYAEYPIVYMRADNCTIEPKPEVIHTGETISFTVTPNDGYYVSSIISEDATCECETNVKIGHVTVSNPIEHPKFNMVYLDFDIRKIETYDIVYKLNYCSAPDGPATIKRFETATIHLTPFDHYNNPESVEVRGAEYTYDPVTGVLDIIETKTNVLITIAATSNPIFYSVKFLNKDGTELYSNVYTYGAVPSYPYLPPKYFDKDKPREIYEFSGWSPEIHPVEGNDVYIAQYRTINCDAYVKIFIPQGSSTEVTISGTSETGGYLFWEGPRKDRTDFGPGAFSDYGYYFGPEEGGEEICIKFVCEDVDNIKISAVYGEHYRDRATITEFCLNKAATTIPTRAFIDCNIKSIIFEKDTKLTTIGSRAFENSTELESINLPDTVTSIGSEAFKGCSNLTTVNIPDSLTTISPYTFEGCEKLEEYTCTENSQLESIGENAFLDCTSLKKIKIPAKLETITTGQHASFKNCSSIEEINIDEDNKVFTTEVDGKECNAIIKKVDGGNILILGSYKSIINEGITEIGPGAFYGTPIKEVKIPSTVKNIHYSAFDCCSEIESMVVAEGNPVYKSKDSTGKECNCIISNDGHTVLKGCYEMSLSEDFTNVGRRAFFGCAALEEVEIPSSVTRIEMEAFMQCPDLKKLTFAPNSKIGYLGQDSFQGCGSLEEVVIPKSLSSLSDGYVFPQCSKLSNVIFEEGSTLENIGCRTFWGCGIEHIDLPSSLKEIGEEAFASCKLTSIKIPSSVVLIKSQAFDSCASLTIVDLTEFANPNNVPVAGNSENPFRGCPEELRLYVASQEMRDAFIAKGGGWPADANKYVIGAPSI